VIDFKNWFKKPKPPSELDLTIQKLKLFDSHHYENAYSSDMSLLELVIYEETIAKYLKLLNLINESLRLDRQIPIYQLPREVKRIYFRDFLIDEKGLFVDIQSSIQQMVNLMIEVLECYQSLEQQPQKSFNTEKNLLQVQHIVANIMYLAKEVL